MNVFIALATTNDFLRKEFIKLRNGVALPANLSETAIKLELGTPEVGHWDTLEDYFHAKSACNDALLVIADHACATKIDFTPTALFSYRLEIPQRVENPAPFLKHHLSRLLNHFSAFKQLNARGENYLVSILPALNFDADEWRQLLDKVRCETHSDTFIKEVEILLTDIRRKRRKPRRKNKDRTHFFIDDDDKHFLYGPEHHSQFETGEPHTKSCDLNGRFRFGRKVDDPRRHFNVNRGSGRNPSVKGAFVNCHKETREVTKTSHLNMFMNDFF
ncbi:MULTISPECIES: hypothetical protein [Pseudomonas syringae group]|uniref:Uncharacterized protein n=2 Tax=Pseudomonas syringae group genomosp. 2 TaxID=251698 RepID=A0AAX1W122_PSEAJ|nr:MULTISPECIES: hypothetical protein [Pseudomonas syringae group]KEZ27487.1 hypothetical protein A3SK_0109395 [Pseudomonas amygdali pv. tabaci str. 6605]KEZ64581.1 hypothetical protein C1E_0226465 [Pseudomonas amygdali pv. tabaci str. ATCC 11528]KIY16811.1 hypothetical protein RD00_23355 [Pseudomonas amygdali pv. tabaci]OSN24767.1 hypothetical protein BV339_00306 [Pseudomonas syringae pv. actinidiae]QED82917.1 hypothetical protein PSYTB_03945 [Pseudomonas amygdali pv. tabaci str. ATCC 11528]